jgi:heme/copper-type cytochrome/quinol oxidase subunit 2
VTTQDHYVRELWHITYIFAVPIGLIVLGLILWCMFRYREGRATIARPPSSSTTSPSRRPTPIIPLVIVAIVFGFMYNAENHVDATCRRTRR